MSNTPQGAAQASALDLDDAIQQEIGTLVLKHPLTGAPTTSTVQLAGVIHPLRVAHYQAKQREVQKAMQLEGSYTLPDPADAEVDEVDYLARSTLGWNLVAGGQPIPFSTEAARQLYADPRRHWVRQQVKQALGQQELFIGSSAPA